MSFIEDYIMGGNSDAYYDELAEAAWAKPKVDPFKGDTESLRDCINALLSLDAKGVLVHNGIGGHVRTLLASAAIRL